MELVLQCVRCLNGAMCKQQKCISSGYEDWEVQQASGEGGVSASSAAAGRLCVHMV